MHFLAPEDFPSDEEDTESGGKGEEGSGSNKPAAVAPWLSLDFFADMKATGVEPVVTEEALTANEKKWATCTTKALERYNLMEHTSFTYLESVYVDVHILLLTRLLAHMNFRAQSDDDGSIRLFYAEVFVVSEKDEASVVKGCCLLKKIDSANPLSNLCCLCYNTVIHPGLRYGYRSAGGAVCQFPLQLLEPPCLHCLS